MAASAGRKDRSAERAALTSISGETVMCASWGREPRLDSAVCTAVETVSAAEFALVERVERPVERVIGSPCGMVLRRDAEK